MRRSTLFLAAIAAVVIGAPGSGFAQTAGKIADSPHDLSSGLPTNADKNEVCVYCHTPHNGPTGVVAPLWNKTLPADTSFTTYDSLNSTTIDATFLTVGSVSLACLSCHDGTQAVDSVINAPGTGAGTSPLGTLGPLTTFANLGSDLTNDHPIGVQYAGFDPGGGQIDPDFVAPDGPVTINGTQVWWVDTDTNNLRDKTDMILYTRDNGGTNQPFVECGSCHDPHSGSAADVAGGGTNAPGSDISFMRLSNESSAVCLACHDK